MTLSGRDRRGLTEIVAISGMTVSAAGVVVTELVTGHEPDKILIGALVGLILLVTGRGVQSAAERGASSEIRNHEAAELRTAAERFEKAIERIEALADDTRRAATEHQRHSMEVIERLMTAATRPPRGD
jgi:hypothetical protein